MVGASTRLEARVSLDFSISLQWALDLWAVGLAVELKSFSCNGNIPSNRLVGTEHAGT